MLLASKSQRKNKSMPQDLSSLRSPQLGGQPTSTSAPCTDVPYPRLSIPFHEWAHRRFELACGRWIPRIQDLDTNGADTQRPEGSRNVARSLTCSSHDLAHSKCKDHFPSLADIVA